MEEKIGRNDPCPCGSGYKWKKCCGAVPKIKKNGGFLEVGLNFSHVPWNIDGLLVLPEISITSYLQEACLDEESVCSLLKKIKLCGNQVGIQTQGRPNSLLIFSDEICIPLFEQMGLDPLCDGLSLHISELDHDGMLFSQMLALPHLRIKKHAALFPEEFRPIYFQYVLCHEFAHACGAAPAIGDTEAHLQKLDLLADAISFRTLIGSGSTAGVIMCFHYLYEAMGSPVGMDDRSISNFVDQILSQGIPEREKDQ